MSIFWNCVLPGQPCDRNMPSASAIGTSNPTKLSRSGKRSGAWAELRKRFDLKSWCIFPLKLCIYVLNNWLQYMLNYQSININKPFYESINHKFNINHRFNINLQFQFLMLFFLKKMLVTWCYMISSVTGLEASDGQSFSTLDLHDQRSGVKKWLPWEKKTAAGRVFFEITRRRLQGRCFFKRFSYCMFCFFMFLQPFLRSWEVTHREAFQLPLLVAFGPKDPQRIFVYSCDTTSLTLDCRCKGPHMKLWVNL